MKTSQRQSQGVRRFVSTCSFLLVLCWLAIAGWNLSKRPEALNAFSVGFVVVLTVIPYLIPRAIAKVVFWMKGGSPTREAIREMQAMRVAKDDFQPVPGQNEIETGLSAAWSKLVQDADDLLLNLVAEKTKSLQGHKPNRVQVLEFLRGLQGSETEPDEAPAPPSHVVSGQAETPTGRKSPTRLVVTMEDGERIDRRAATDSFVEAIEKLGIERVRNLGHNVGRFSLISTSQSHSRQRKSGRYYIMIHNTTTADKKQLLETIASQLGVQLKVETPLKD